MTTLRYTVSVLVLLLVFTACSNRKRDGGSGLDTPELGELLYDSQKYGLESAVITYRVTGYETGSEELSFDDYGIREARVVKTSAQLGTGRHLLELYRGPKYYRVHLNDKWGMTNDRPEIAYLLTHKQPLKPGEWTAHNLNTGGFIKTGEAELLGRPCIVWKHPQLNVERWVWNGIILRTESRGSAGFVSEAQSIAEDTDIPEGRFEVPDGIRME